MLEETSLLIERLIDTPCWIIDILPQRVSKDMADKYVALERELLHTDELRTKLFRFLLKLNCYYRFKVILPDDEEIDDISTDSLKELAGYRYIQILIGDSLMVSDPDDMYMSVYNPTDCLLDLMSKLAGSEGLFIWRVEDAVSDHKE